MSDRYRLADLRAEAVVKGDDELLALVEAVRAAHLVAKNPAVRALPWYPRLRSALARFDFEAQA